MYSIDDATKFLADVRAECLRATQHHGEFNSCHEGYAVLLEEVDELWEWVRRKAKNRDLDAMRTECVQIAAMAMKYAITLCEIQKEK